MTCLHPICASQRSVSGLQSARFSESLGIHFSRAACPEACNAVSGMAAEPMRNFGRRVAMAISWRGRKGPLVMLGVQDTPGHGWPQTSSGKEATVPAPTTGPEFLALLRRYGLVDEAALLDYFARRNCS